MIIYEKYRPTSFDDMILTDALRNQYKSILSGDSVPHLILHSIQAGTGKTTATNILTNALDAEVLRINASETNGIDILRNDVNTFCMHTTERKYKIVVLDEADRLTSAFQDAFRGLIEKYNDYNVRFFLTCNHIDQITDPIKSRCLVIDTSNFGDSTKEFKIKMRDNVLDIMTKEGVDVSTHIAREVVSRICELHFPDNRTILNQLQYIIKSNNGVLDEKAIAIANKSDIFEKAWDAITAKSKDRIKIIEVSHECKHHFNKLCDFLLQRLYTDISINRSNFDEILAILAEHNMRYKECASIHVHTVTLLSLLAIKVKFNG